MTPSLQEVQRAAIVMRQAVKDRTYRATPLGLVVGRYYRWKKTEWGATEETLRDYEGVLRALCRYYADLEITDFEPPRGAELLRECIAECWPHAAPATRKKVLAVFRDFFRWARKSGLIVVNPALDITSPRVRHDRRDMTLTNDFVRKAIAGVSYPADRIAMRLITVYGLRRGELRNLRIKHMDPFRRQITVYGKGGKTRVIPVGLTALWDELGALLTASELSGDHFLMYYHRKRLRRVPLHDATEVLNVGNSLIGYTHAIERSHPVDKPVGGKRVHIWWYECLAEAGLVDPGTTSGVNMHRGRHTAATNLLRAPNSTLEHVRQFLGHESIQTTADIYAHLDIGDMAEMLRPVEEDLK